MTWLTVAPTCNQFAKHTGIESIPADADAFNIKLCAPTPPYVLFLTPNWNTGYDYVQFTDHVHVRFSVTAPGDGSGLLSWEWQIP